MDAIDPRLIEQRIRNRLIEYVGWVREYESEREPRIGMGELLNQWEDFITRPISDGNFPIPVFTADEINALNCLDTAWELLCSATPSHITHDSDVFKMSEWADFVSRAGEAAKVFDRRGKLSEDLPL